MNSFDEGIGFTVGDQPYGQNTGKFGDAVLRNLDGLLPNRGSLQGCALTSGTLDAGDPHGGCRGGRLRAAGYEVTTGVGKTGVVGLLRNGDGPTVMLRADMDALPVEEATGLPYASKATATDRDGKTVPVAHMCGHDMHVTWLAGATKLLAEPGRPGAARSWRFSSPEKRPPKARRP